MHIRAQRRVLRAPGLARLVLRTEAGLLRTFDLTITAEDLAVANKQLLAVERGWRDCKTSVRLRPVYHHCEDRIRAHVQLCCLAPEVTLRRLGGRRGGCSRSSASSSARPCGEPIS
jgi:hypothetical protein